MKKGLLIFKCKECGFEGRIRERSLDWETIRAIKMTDEIYCDKCNMKLQLRVPRISFFANGGFSVATKVTSIEALKSIERAKQLAKWGDC